MPSNFIAGLSGLVLTDRERGFLSEARPAGVILFARNISDREQVRRLIGAVREAVGGEMLVLVDQEGGRVQRLKPPHWRRLPPAAAFGRLADDRDPASAAGRVARLVAADLRELGITCNCMPVLDIPVPGSHTVIGDRAYATEVADVIRLGRAVMEAHMAGGVLPVIKHIPGHGRATADSHLALPVVTAPRGELEATDFAPFKALADAPAAMTAHVVYTAVDAALPGSVSATVHSEIIRGSIGFDGLLMSDDLSMRALSGSLADRAGAVLRAGSDIALHCNGDMTEMTAVASVARPLTGDSLARFERALRVTGRADRFDVAEAEACLAELLRLSA